MQRRFTTNRTDSLVVWLYLALSYSDCTSKNHRESLFDFERSPRDWFWTLETSIEPEKWMSKCIDRMKYSESWENWTEIWIPEDLSFKGFLLVFLLLFAFPQHKFWHVFNQSDLLLFRKTNTNSNLQYK